MRTRSIVLPRGVLAQRPFSDASRTFHGSRLTWLRHAPQNTNRSATHGFITHKTIRTISDIFAINHFVGQQVFGGDNDVDPSLHPDRVNAFPDTGHHGNTDSRIFFGLVRTVAGFPVPLKCRRFWNYLVYSSISYF